MLYILCNITFVIDLAFQKEGKDAPRNNIRKRNDPGRGI